MGEAVVYLFESSNLLAGEDVPMPTSPADVTLIRSDPAVLKNKVSSFEPEVSSARINVF